MLVASLGVAPAVASAEVRFASPAGAGSGTCTAAEPACTLQRAVETVAQPGDEVVMQTGTYNEGTNPIIPPVAMQLHGAAGQPRPVIVSSFVGSGSGAALDVGVPNVLVQDLEIDQISATGAALSIQAASTAERVIVNTSASMACVPALGAVIRDSICHTTAAGAAAVRFFTSTDISTATLTNVTAVASGANANGIDLQVFDVGVETLNATNVIASGTGTAADVSAVNNASGSVTINLDHSNYDTENEPNASTTVTDPGSPTNQTAPPVFADPAANFHQLAGSPTIDAGSAGPGLGTADIDGAPRSAGSAPDIGADEFVPPAAATPPGDTFPPDTGILKGPKKKTSKRHFKFTFGGSEPGVTFECQLDDGGWEACTSPHRVKGLKRGKHVFAVRAIDAAGNPDPTPADRRWKVIKPPASR